MLPGSRLSLRPTLAAEPCWLGRALKGLSRGTSRNSTRARGRAAASTWALRRSNTGQPSPSPSSRASRPARASTIVAACSRLGPSSGRIAACRPAPTSSNRLTIRCSARLRASQSFRAVRAARPIASAPSSRLGCSPVRPMASRAMASHCSGAVAPARRGGRDRRRAGAMAIRRGRRAETAGWNCELTDGKPASQGELGPEAVAQRPFGSAGQRARAARLRCRWARPRPAGMRSAPSTRP